MYQTWPLGGSVNQIVPFELTTMSFEVTPSAIVSNEPSAA